MVAAERWPESSFKSGLCFVVSLFLSSLDFTYTVCVCLCVCVFVQELLNASLPATCCMRPAWQNEWNIYDEA